MNTNKSHQQKPAVIVHRSNAPSEPVVLRFKAWLLRLSLLALLLAVLIIILEVASLATNIAIGFRVPAGVVGSAIWGGIFLAVTAAIEVAGVRKEHRCLLKSYLVLAIVAAALFCVVIVAMGSLWAVLTKNFDRYRLSSESDASKYPTEFRNIANIQVTIAVFSFVYAVIAIVVSSLLCASLCSCCKKSTADRYIMSNIPTGDQAHSHTTSAGQPGTSARFSGTDAAGSPTAPPAYDEGSNSKPKTPVY